MPRDKISHSGEQEGKQERERKQKLLELYKKALLAHDFDTAKNLKLTDFTSEELRQARQEAFSEELTKYIWTEPGAIKHTQQQFELDDESAATEVERYCIRRLQNPVTLETEKGKKSIGNVTIMEQRKRKYLRKRFPRALEFLLVRSRYSAFEKKVWLSLRLKTVWDA